MKSVEQMLEELHADKCSVHVMLHAGTKNMYVSVDQSADYSNKFEFKINENLTLYEAVKKAYDRYMKITNAAPELVPHRLPPPATTQKHDDGVQDAEFREVAQDTVLF